MQRPLLSVKPGQWVTSTAGRDKGCHYLVWRLSAERSLEVVDGLRRTLAAPKRKSLRHVWVHDAVDQAIGARFEAGQKVTNTEIQSALMELVREEEEVG